MQYLLELLGVITLGLFVIGAAKMLYGTWRDARRFYRCPHITGGNPPAVNTIFHLLIGPVHVEVCSACMQAHRDAVASAPLDDRDLHPITPVPDSFRKAFEDHP